MRKLGANFQPSDFGYMSSSVRMMTVESGALDDRRVRELHAQDHFFGDVLFA